MEIESWKKANILQKELSSLSLEKKNIENFLEEAKYTESSILGVQLNFKDVKCLLNPRRLINSLQNEIDYIQSEIEVKEFEFKQL